MLRNCNFIAYVHIFIFLKITGGSQQGSGEGSGVGRGAGQQGTARGSARPPSFILTTRPVTAKVKVGDKGAPFNAYTNAFKVFMQSICYAFISYLLGCSEGL